MKIGQTFFKTAGLLSLLTLIPALTLGHTTGASVELEVGDYLVDIGYTPEIVDSNSQVRFDLTLFEKTTGEEVPFDDVWVRIEKEDNVYFAAGLSKQPFGSTGMTHRFVESGEYEIFIRFSNDSDPLAEVTFPFAVNELTKAGFLSEISLSQRLILIAVGIGLGFLLCRFTPKRSDHDA